MINNVLVFSNNFGFGPISRAFMFAKIFHESFPDSNVVLVISEATGFTSNASGFTVKTIKDVRDRQDVADFLLSYRPENTLVVSVMNRFAIDVAKERNIKTLLIDGLYWFWKNRPKEYDYVDYQIRCVLPWQLEQYHNSDKIFYCVSPFEHIAATGSNNKTLLSVNGFTTPYYTPEHDSYLRLISRIANDIDGDVLVVGNRDARDKIVEHLGAVPFEALSKEAYVNGVAHCKEIILNGGSNSFLEALSSDKQILFSLPSNQSQYALIESIAEQLRVSIEDICPCIEIISVHHKISEFQTEKEAVDYIATQISDFLDRPNASDQLHNILKKQEKARKIMRKFIDRMQPTVLNSNQQLIDSLNELCCKLF
jgi:hypothetical protein